MATKLKSNLWFESVRIGQDAMALKVWRLVLKLHLCYEVSLVQCCSDKVPSFRSDKIWSVHPLGFALKLSATLSTR